jgi:hypothetical protein
MTYAEKLRSPEWQKKRLEILQRDNFTCQNCGDTKKTLEVHHRHYVRGAAPWMYVEGALVTLCEDCHARWHEVQDRVNAVICDMTASQFLDIRTDTTLEQLGEHLRAIGAERERKMAVMESYAKGREDEAEGWRKRFGECHE